MKTTSEPKRTLITAALPYANGPVHIGHLAGCYLPADIYARYLRLSGKDVLFVCGSDEHGVAITLKAKKEGITPQQLVDKYHHLMKDSFARFGISFDIYHRTSEKLHAETASDFFKVMHEKGGFIEKTEEQYYDEEQKQFLADRYITGTCPRCGNGSAYGDQCEKCGTSLSPKDLINPRSAISGNTPVLKTTSHWYLPLDQLQETFLNEYINKHKDDWKVNVFGQCKSWLDAGLQPRAITRDLDWGVPVPVKGAEGKVLYVWFDAPIGYVSATKAWCEANGKNWHDYWDKNSGTRLLHFIGKDNIVFHCLIFPAILHAQGEFVLPDNVPANEFLNLEGDKISTSRNWAVWLHEYLNDFPGREDELRYVLTSIAPETKDSDFSWKDYQQRVNSELVSILGNFVNRVMVLTWKFFDGKVPAYNSTHHAQDNQYRKEIKFGFHVMEEALHHFRFREAQAELMNIARLGNKYLAELEPWHLIKTDKEKTASVLHMGLQIAAALSIAGRPFLPNTSDKIAALLKLTFDKKLWDIHFFESLEFLGEGHQLNEASILFKPIEDEEVQKQIDRLAQIKKDNEMQATAEPAKLNVVKGDIAYDDFDKIDLRVGKVLSAEHVPKADKLLKLTVDLGFEQRTILSGIAEYYKPEELVGKLVTVVANLAPRKIRGIESQGMLLMAGNDFGKLYSVGPEKDIEPGSVVK